MSCNRDIFSRNGFQASIVAFESSSEFRIRIAAGVTHSLAMSRIQIMRVVRRVKLDVNDSLGNEIFHFAANNLNQIGQKVGARGIEVIRDSFLVAGDEEV